jgi:hypothetical protein
MTRSGAWFKLFSKNKLAKAMLIKLALIPIMVFAQDMFADESKTQLIPCSVTNLWISAYRVAGAPWNRQTAPPKKAQVKASTLKASNKPIPTKSKTYATALATPSPHSKKYTAFHLNQPRKHQASSYLVRPANL